MSDEYSEGSRTCIHCGAKIPREVRGKFCCSGCSHVYRLIHEAGLEKYYDYRDEIIEPVGTRAFLERDFAELRDWQKSHELDQTSEIVEGELSLQGISCAGCVWLVERIFQRQGGAIKIQIEANTGYVLIRWQKGLFKMDKMAREAARFAYIFEYPKALNKANTESLSTRLKLCAAFMIGELLFTHFGYSETGNEVSTIQLFDLLKVLCACLSFFVGANYFIRRAWRSLRLRELPLDLPIGLALILGFFGANVGRFLGESTQFQFEFYSVFVFLILGVHWGQECYLGHFQDRRKDPFSKTAKILSQEASLHEIGPDTVTEIRPGDILPVEALLESEGGELSHDWLSGESEPIRYESGERVPAGARNQTDGSLQFRTLEGWKDSILRRFFDPQIKMSAQNTMMDRFLKYQLLAIFLSASLGGILWAVFGDWNHSSEVMMAMLIVASPTAIGMAWSKIVEGCQRSLQDQGIFINRSNFFEALGEIRNLIVDLEGIEWLFRPRLLNTSELSNLDGVAKAELLGLLMKISNPLADSLRRQLQEESLPPIILENYRKISENNFSALVAEREVSLDISNESEEIVFSIKGVADVCFKFSSGVCRDFLGSLEAITRRGLNVDILGGDRSEEARKMYQDFNGKTGRRCTQTHSPEAKARLIQEIGPKETMMIGDGVSASLAFKTAGVQGAAIQDLGRVPQDVAFYFSGRGLGGIKSLFETVDAMNRIRKLMLRFAGVYALIALTSGMFGILDLFVAVILMLVNSIVMLITFRRFFSLICRD
ncbi:MAG: heavy metal translocating P-type ATPase metal-binding domain-containing protein [Verrucomicrobiota bacterium]